MRRTTLLLSLTATLLVAACAALYVQHRADAAAVARVEQSEESTRAQYSRAIQDISTIQDSLNAIAVDETSGLRSSALSSERRLSPGQGDETLARIAELRAGIERTRTRIQSLEQRLKESSGHVAGLGRLIKQLKVGLSAKEQQVAILSSQVDSLQTHVAGLNVKVEAAQTQIAAQTDTLEERRRELGTVYYVIGTRSALLKDGVVVARGGVLGLGRTLDASGKMDPTAFRTVDTDQETTIPIAATKARVLTPQAPGSYAIEQANGQLELHILDAREFRKVRHLVIVTA